MNNLNERSRAFVFTTNNQAAETLQSLRRLEQSISSMEEKLHPLPELLTSRDMCTSQCANLRTVVAKLPGSHVAVARGSCKQNYEYCTKAGDYDEYGEKPLNPEEKGEEEKERWRRTLSLRQRREARGYRARIARPVLWST